MMRSSVLALTVASLAASEIQAQRAGNIEVGLFPTIGYMDKSLRMEQGRAGPGARLGFFLTDGIAIEADGSWIPQRAEGDFEVKYIPLHARVVANFLAGDAVGFLIGAGYGLSLYRDEADVTDNGFTGNVGVRLGLGDVTSIRIDSYLDWIPSPDNGAGYNLNWGIQPGLSFLLGGRDAGPRDRDQDGVPDDVDQCKKTPAGDKVDAKGCTVKDADGDGVADEADACADTPA
jgi:OOP family OmpA-OmpF porin